MLIRALNFRSFPFPISSDVKKEKERRRGREEGRRQKKEKVKGKRKESKWWWPRPGALAPAPAPAPAPAGEVPVPRSLLSGCAALLKWGKPLSTLSLAASLSSAQRRGPSSSLRPPSATTVTGPGRRPGQTRKPGGPIRRSSGSVRPSLPPSTSRGGRPSLRQALVSGASPVRPPKAIWYDVHFAAAGVNNRQSRIVQVCR